ncbi:MAG: helix-turn-helix domain-containing protein [Candidatus Symbiothrix sp.]|jgi:transcriptional regulator with XRE-family HTH domain|nr:helix-turn-helix domain-containing protein [Candidatus Symbiothrix sp.]
MSKNSNIIFSYSMSDAAVLETLGAQIKQMRLNKNTTQSRIADISGLSRRAVSDLENKGTGTLTSFVQVLRALNKLEILNHFITEAPVSPIQIAKMHGKMRQRASHARKKGVKPYPIREYTPLIAAEPQW